MTAGTPRVHGALRVTQLRQKMRNLNAVRDVFL